MTTIHALKRWLVRLLLTLAIISLWPTGARSHTHDLAPTSQYWVDPTGLANIQTVSQLPPEALSQLDGSPHFRLGAKDALWVRLNLPEQDPLERWYLALDISSPTELAHAYQPDGADGWRVQQAGDHIPVNEWTIPDRTPLFEVTPDNGLPITWLRLENHPMPLSTRVHLINETQLRQERAWTFLLVGGYLGFGVLALFLGWVHLRLYEDRAFVAYMAYVASMLGFQAAFTGVGGLFFWPGSAAWNTAAPPVFMLWLTGAGLWFVSEVCPVSRFPRVLKRFIQAWSVFGLLYPAVYVYLDNAVALSVLNAYGLLSLVLGVAICIWTLRQGDRYAGWLVMAFLPVQLGYASLALHASGLTPEAWATPYAILIGSAIEIPLLLYLLHRRAKEFTENRARMRVIDSTDPLTGLPVIPIFELRLQDAIRRSRRFRHQSGLLMVEVDNHHEIGARLGQATGDRALVVAAARLSEVVREVDTVCRVRPHRFAMLIEGPRKLEHLKLLSQHIVAKGLGPGSALPDGTRLRFRVALTMLPTQQDIGEEEEESSEALHIKEQLHQTLDQARDQAPEAAHRSVILLCEPV